MTSLVLMVRCLLGCVLLRAGVAKLSMGPSRRNAAVLRYSLLPKPVIPWAARALFVTELGLACLLLAGVGLRLAGIITAILFAVFSGAIALNLARDRVFECGCGSSERPISWRLVAQDLVLCTASTLLAIFPNRAFALWASWGAPQAHPVGIELLPVPMLTLLALVMSVVIIRGSQLRLMHPPTILETVPR